MTRCGRRYAGLLPVLSAEEQAAGFAELDPQSLLEAQQSLLEQATAAGRALAADVMQVGGGGGGHGLMLGVWDRRADQAMGEIGRGTGASQCTGAARVSRVGLQPEGVKNK